MGGRVRRVKENNYLQGWKAHKVKNDKHCEIWLTGVMYGRRRTGREVCVSRDILERDGCGPVDSLRSASGWLSLFSPQTTDDIVSSAECSSDDEDLEECDSGHAGGMGVSSCACAECGLFPLILSLICHWGAPPPSIMSHGSFKCNFEKERKINKSFLKSSQSEKQTLFWESSQCKSKVKKPFGDG